jgi:sulfatase maturation enzyme AslB (radical SAM superfamily)
MKSLFAGIPNAVTGRGWRTKFRIWPELTNHCNFRCVYCPHSVYRKESAGGNRFDREKGYMSEELWSLVVDNAAKYASYVGLGFFGEPLLHPEFRRYVEMIPCRRRYGFDLFTNWSLVTRENMESLKHFDCVRISFDASYAELWEQLCPGGTVLDLDGGPSGDRYSTLVSKMEYWLRQPDHAPTNLHCVVSEANQHYTKQLIAKWRPRLGSRDYIWTKTIISYGGIMRDAHITANACDIPSSRKVSVAWNGDCTPCNLDVNLEWRAGNLAEARDIKRIVEADKWCRVVASIARKEGMCVICLDANNRSEDRFYYGGETGVRTRESAR